MPSSSSSTHLQQAHPRPHRGAVEARLAHNQKVGRSKLPDATSSRSSSTSPSSHPLIPAIAGAETKNEFDSRLLWPSTGGGLRLKFSALAGGFQLCDYESRIPGSIPGKGFPACVPARTLSPCAVLWVLCCFAHAGGFRLRASEVWVACSIHAVG